MLGILVLGVFAAFDDRLYTLHDIETAIDDGIVVVIPGIRASCHPNWRRRSRDHGADSKRAHPPMGP